MTPEQVVPPLSSEQRDELRTLSDLAERLCAEAEATNNGLLAEAGEVIAELSNENWPTVTDFNAAYRTAVNAAETAETQLAEARAEIAALSSPEMREFVDASVAVWREVDRLTEDGGDYPGIPPDTGLRRREKAAWERYRATLDPPTQPAPREEGEVPGG